MGRGNGLPRRPERLERSIERRRDGRGPGGTPSFSKAGARGPDTDLRRARAGVAVDAAVAFENSRSRSVKSTSCRSNSIRPSVRLAGIHVKLQHVLDPERTMNAVVELTANASWCPSGSVTELSVDSTTDTATPRFACSGGSDFTATVRPLPA
jgi:hypothetical protein